MDPDGMYRDIDTDDVLVEILLRLHPNTRRRLRLVCRHWRDVVGTRTPTNLRSRVRALIVTSDSAYVADDLSDPRIRRRPRDLWAYSVRPPYHSLTEVVGTCNGLVCLCNNLRNGGAITIANPATQEELAVPRLELPPPCGPAAGLDDKWYSPWWHDAYSFAYLRTTGRYAVVHVPCRVNETDGPFVYEAVHFLLFGDTSWRAVPAGPAARCDTICGVISVDGATYWVASDKHVVMSFDIEDERVTSIVPPPSVLKDGSSWHLADVDGRLGIVFHETPDKAEVWVMEDGATEEFRWSRWYIIQTSTPLERRLTRPLLVLGEHVLTWEWSSKNKERGRILYRHTPSGRRDHARRNAKRGVIEICEGNPGTVVADINKLAHFHDVRRLFAYVETREPLPSAPIHRFSGP